MYIIRSGDGYYLSFGLESNLPIMTSDPLVATRFTQREKAASAQRRIENMGFDANIITLHIGNPPLTK